MKIFVSDTEIVEGTKEQILSILGLSDEQLGEVSEKVAAARKRILKNLVSDYRMCRIRILIDDNPFLNFSAELPERDEEGFNESFRDVLASAANMLTAPKVEGFPIEDL